MGIWLSIRDFCVRWKAELLLYGIGFLLLASALATGKGLAAGVVFFILIVWDVARRWGEPWRQMGEAEFRRRQQASRAYWQERAQAFFARLNGNEDDAPAASTPGADGHGQPTRLIRQPQAGQNTALTPSGDPEEEPPESPGGIQETAPPRRTPPPAAPEVPVTHDT